MKKIILTLVVVLFASTSAFAFNYSYYDFGQDNIFDYNNNYSPIDYPYDIGHLPSPGNYNDGGEFFDLEALNVASDNDFLYLSITNSFGYEQDGFRLGDLFIGVGTDKYRYAVDLQAGGVTGGLFAVDSWNEIQDDPYSYYDTRAIREMSGAHEINTGTFLGDASSVSSIMKFESALETDFLNPSTANGDTYVWELKIDRSLINGGDLNGLSFHVNVGCGNDLMETTYSSVPEPATILLFGLGLLGGAIQRRRKS